MKRVLGTFVSSPQCNSVLIREKWWTGHVQCVQKQVLLLEQWSVSPVTRVTSWKVPARFHATDETPAPPNGAIGALSVSVSPLPELFFCLLVIHDDVQLMSVHCVFLIGLNSKIWPVPKPWCPWQWLPNLIQTQLPGRRNSAFLLLWRLWTYWRGYHQLCPWSSLSVEQPTTVL